MNILKDVFILINLEVSNHCFVDKSLFTSYTLYNSLKTGLSADRDFIFTIFGRGLVQFSTKINGVSQKIILNNTLHTPNLHLNLILVSRLGLKSTQVNFTKDSIVVTISDDCPIMSATCFGQLYAVSILGSPPISY